MKKTTLKKLLSMTLCIVLAAALALFAAGCGDNTASSAVEQVSSVASSEASIEAAASEAAAPEASAQDAAEAAVLGEGATEFTFTVVDADGNESVYEIHTDAATVGEALFALELIEGEDTEFGMYVKTVNGITADYDTDGTYWAFYINDEYAATGVDATDVEAGAVYSFRVEK